MQQQSKFTYSKIFANLNDASHLQFLPAISMIIVAMQSIVFIYDMCDIRAHLELTSARNKYFLATLIFFKFSLKFIFLASIVKLIELAT